MNSKSMHWVNRLAALGLVVGLVAGLAAVGGDQSVGDQAYSTYVNTPLGSSGQSPLAVLPAVSGTDGAEADAEGSALNVAGALSSDFLNSITSGEIGAAEAGAQSTSSAASRSEEHTSELQSPCNLVCRLLLEKKKNEKIKN